MVLTRRHMTHAETACSSNSEYLGPVDKLALPNILLSCYLNGIDRKTEKKITFITILHPWLFEWDLQKSIEHFPPSAIWMEFREKQGGGGDDCNSVSVMEFSIPPHKWEYWEIWYSYASSPPGKFFTYIWLCIVSIPYLAMRISASPSLIWAGQRGQLISRAILKYSKAVRCWNRLLM